LLHALVANLPKIRELPLFWKPRIKGGEECASEICRGLSYGGYLLLVRFSADFEHFDYSMNIHLTSLDCKSEMISSMS
jgi:hypothetical protein